MSQNMMTVSSLNTKIKSLLEATFMHTLVEGEVSSVTYHTSGHLYFSIKDDKSSIKCVMWRSSVSKMKFHIEKGMHIVVTGSISVYTPRGEYQFQTVHIEPYGQGALALAYEQLKEKLKKQGYFKTEHKKKIPKYIQKIALVTAKESAALYDMLKVIEKRWAHIEVIVVDTLVQGEAAKAQIARSLKYADTLNVDVVIVGRGGGSSEDLWVFNEEKVADAIFNMKTPVVSAVGHEVDVMISDFVADLRAPTPSAAIEMIILDSKEILFMLDELWKQYQQITEHKIDQISQEKRHIEEMLLRSSPFEKLVRLEVSFKQLRDEFKKINQYQIEKNSLLLPKIVKNFKDNIYFTLKRKEQYLEYLKQKINLNNPSLKSKKGWAQIHKNKQIITLDELKIGDIFTVEETTLKINAKVLEKSYMKSHN